MEWVIFHLLYNNSWCLNVLKHIIRNASRPNISGKQDETWQWTLNIEIGFLKFARTRAGAGA